MTHKTVLFISLCFAVCCLETRMNAQDLTVGSYNIRFDNQGDRDKGNGWERRCPILVNQVLFNDFDIIGMQEVLHNQLEDLLFQMSQYAYIGVGRDDGQSKGEYSPIFYKKKRFKLLRSGHFWLSENTDYPNKGWDAALPRICTWGLLKDLKNKRFIWFFNLHLDHVGVEARRQSANLVLRKIAEMCGKNAVVLTGDFNVDQTTDSYKLIAQSNTLFDTYEQADARYALNGTFNNFRSNQFSNSRIDHIFVSNHFKVSRYGILTDSYRTPTERQSADETDALDAEARMISDHFPVKVTLYYR